MEQISILPAREQVAGVLRKAIFSGELEIGRELTQEEIANQLGISRMPVREAFQILERDGLLTLKNNRRAVVRGLTDSDIVDHYEIRAMLEGEASAKACIQSAQLDDIVQAQKDMELASKNKDISGYLSANEFFHRAIWEASASSRLESILNHLWNGLPPHLPELLPNQIQKSISEHQAIITALKEKNEQKARTAMMTHIKRSMEDLLKYRDHGHE